jgi:hypothetical protein
VQTYQREASWYPRAAEATRDLLERTSAWGPPPAPLGFNLGKEPKPTPVMRVTPKA